MPSIRCYAQFGTSGLIRLLGWHGVGSRGRGSHPTSAAAAATAADEQGPGGPGFDMLAMECLEALLMAMQRRIRYLRDRHFYDRLPVEAQYGIFRRNFHRFDRFELDLRGHTRP